MRFRTDQTAKSKGRWKWIWIILAVFALIVLAVRYANKVDAISQKYLSVLKLRKKCSHNADTSSSKPPKKEEEPPLKTLCYEDIPDVELRYEDTIRGFDDEFSEENLSDSQEELPSDFEQIMLDNWEIPQPEEVPEPKIPEPARPEIGNYVLNIISRKFHKASCVSAKKLIADNNYLCCDTREEAIEMGYTPCRHCNP